MSSQFAAQLGTNYCPKDEELAQIKALLIEPSLRLKHLDEEIESMQKAIDKLSEERESLNAYVEAHKALISPIRRLPLDIVGEIFMACIPTHRNCVMSADEAPVILGRICSSWRTISLSTPRLWSTLHIVEPTRPYSSSPGLYEAKIVQRLEVADAWLRRSGTCPLSISLESHFDQGITPPLTPPASPPITLFINTLVPFASRWKNIRLVIPPLALETLLSRLTEDDVPLLKSLKIIERPEHPYSNISGTQWSLSQAGVLHGPSLARFSISGSITNSPELPLRWSQLTALSLMGPPWGMGQAQTCQILLDILSKCPKLRSCKLLVNDPPEAPISDSIVECPFLHTFDLLCVGTPLHTSGRVLSRLSLPDLRDFILRGQEEPHSAFTPELLVSSLAASTRLESISIDSNSFSKSFLMDFLRGLPPTVRRLHITEPTHMWRPYLVDPSLDNDALAILDVSLDRPCLALQELVILNCRSVSDEALLHFITSRVPTLRRVNITFDREREVDILPRLQSSVEAGLQIDITYISGYLLNHPCKRCDYGVGVTFGPRHSQMRPHHVERFSCNNTFCACTSHCNPIVNDKYVPCVASHLNFQNILPLSLQGCARSFESITLSRPQGTATALSSTFMSSLFAAHLGTNYCPKDEELGQIKALLIAPCLRLNQVDDEIKSMQKTIDKLTKERDSLNAYVEAHKALISPIRRLPLDIIGEIFVACIPTHRNCVMSADEAPVLLGRICSSWRTISLSTPRLWSRLHIVEPTRPYDSGYHTSTPGLFEAKVAQRLEVTNVWLRRSGTCLLSISFKSNDNSITPPLTSSSSNIDLFLHALIPFASRWQNIHLVIPPFAFKTLSSLTADEVPLLNSLEIVQRSQHPHNKTQWSLSQHGVLRGPRLSRFYMAGNVSSSDLPLRWDQLTTLSLLGPTWGGGHAQTSEVILELLSKCPKLQTCELLVHDPPEGYLPGFILECPVLRTFHLHGVGSTLYTSARLLSRLSLPDLRDFALHGPMGPYGPTEPPGSASTVDSLVSSLVPSTRLESIGIDSDLFSKYSLMDFLRGLPPTVRSLHITDMTHTWRPHGVDVEALDDDVLATLGVSPNHPKICPALQELVIHNCRILSDDALRRFIISRIPALTRVEVNFARERQVDILPALQSLVDDDLKLSITHISPPPLQFSPWQGLPDAPPEPNTWSPLVPL
ncbi:hypothetical protein B0H13DRAFT_1700784 [Mycena leptocephala]|nr:hypothetical protein B0H13DRAFT_1700784 [Mycena leptocephala]